ncbi:MAG: hypothetical protein FWF60_03345 [Oscillospiraceae bacterium]|nr:hypothetical protein [Oscillospiraceae bacterium]
MKKALSALLAAVMVLGLLALAPITAHAATLTANDAASLATALAAAGDNTIRLTADITYNDYIWISGTKTITLDLNGKILSVNNLVACTNGAKLLLANSSNGQFNVSYGDQQEDFTTVWASDAGSKLEVTNVNCTNSGASAVYVDFGGEVTVYGNATSTGSYINL